MPGVTHILAAIERGDPHAAEQLLPLVYEELRKLAGRKPGRHNPLRPWGPRLSHILFSGFRIHLGNRELCLLIGSLVGAS
jgi:hypothetical protein